MIFRTINPDELEGWARLCGEGFKGDWTYFKRHFDDDPWADFGGVFVADDGGKLVSSVRVFRREIYISGDRVTMGGIGEVTTLQEYRGRGLSTKLLQCAASYMETTGLDMSFLFTGTNHHYAHVGWFTLPRRRVKINIEADGGGVELRRANGGDIPLLASLHGKFAPKYSGAVVRTPEYFTRWFDVGAFELVYVNGEPVAYAQLRREEKRGLCHLTEYIGEDMYIMPTLSAAVKGMDIKAAMLPSAIAAGIEYTGNKTDFHEENSLMVRLNKPFKAAGKVIDTVPRLIGALSDAVFFGMDGF